MPFKNRYILPLIAGFSGLLLLASCEDEDAGKPKDTLGSGSITISVDETYRPVIEEQVKVFDSSYPEAHITVNYKPESECIQDFLSGKATLVLVTRDLNAAEKKYCEDKKVVPTSLAVARDAVAVVVNSANPDSVFARPQLVGILTGEYAARKYKVVFDNAGSSTLRFMQDSILKGQKLGANVFSAKSSYDVIDYVSKTADAIGFVGMTYAMDSTATDPSAPFINNVQVAYLTSDSGSYISQPYQAYVADKRYPLTRSLYYINSQTYPGLGTGFANFLSHDRGQLIFKTAQFLPLRTNIVIKDAHINNNEMGQ